MLILIQEHVISIAKHVDPPKIRLAVSNSIFLHIIFKALYKKIIYNSYSVYLRMTGNERKYLALASFS